MDGTSPGAHLVLLQIGRTRLVLAQRDVRSLESATDAEFTDPPPAALGSIAVGGTGCPVFALDDELAPLRVVPRHRRICAMLATDAGSFGLLCDEAQVLPRMDRATYPLPPAMRRAGSPIEGVVTIGAEVALLASARALARIAGAEACLAAQRAEASE
jgi:hypothetical protein